MEKVKAQLLLKTETRAGRVKRPECCSQCFRICDLHAHHDDYSKPLQVRWLCPKCYKDEHLTGTGISTETERNK